MSDFDFGPGAIMVRGPMTTAWDEAHVHDNVYAPYEDEPVRLSGRGLTITDALDGYDALLYTAQKRASE